MSTCLGPVLSIRVHPSIPSHSNIIWLADTNYRIDLDNASVRAYAEDDALDMLLAADQLSYVMSTGVAFSGCPWTDHTLNLRGIPRHGSCHRPCEESPPLPFTRGERHLDGTR